MAAVMAGLKAGVIAGDVAYRTAEGSRPPSLAKPNRIGYSIGVGYALTGANAPCPSAHRDRLSFPRMRWFT